MDLANYVDPARFANLPERLDDRAPLEPMPLPVEHKPGGPSGHIWYESDRLSEERLKLEDSNRKEANLYWNRSWFWDENDRTIRRCTLGGCQIIHGDNNRDSVEKMHLIELHNFTVTGARRKKAK